jgi:hypothetical protein
MPILRRGQGSALTDIFPIRIEKEKNPTQPEDPYEWGMNGVRAVQTLEEQLQTKLKFPRVEC